MSELSEKDLHCIARILQGCIYTDGDMFHCCKYCNYGRECTAEVKEKHTFHFDRVREKLQDITGVYLSIGSYDIEKKFLLPTKAHVEKQ